MNGYRQLQYIIGHVRNKDNIGKRIKQELEYLKFTAGIENPVIQRGVSDACIRWVEPTWVVYINKILSTIDAGLDFTEIWQRQIQREGDVFIMGSIRDNMENT